MVITLYMKWLEYLSFLWDITTGVSLIVDETFQFSPSKCDLTNNITISTRSHQQLIEALHNMQEINKIIPWQDSKINNDDILIISKLNNCSESLITYYWKQIWLNI